MYLAVSKKGFGNRISSMVLIVEFMKVKQVIFIPDQWKRENEMVKDDFMMLNVMKFMLVILR